MIRKAAFYLATILAIVLVAAGCGGGSETGGQGSESGAVVKGGILRIALRRIHVPE